MGQFSLNLSTRPFKAYRAANLGLLLALLVVAAASVVQVYDYRQNSAKAAAIRDTERKAREESDLLTRQLLALNSKMYSGAANMKISEIEFLNQLLVRKSFSWTKVFAHLEGLMPDNVRLVNLRPFFSEDGKVGLNIDVRGRSFTDATGFVRALEDSQIFTNVVVAVEEKQDAGDVEFVLSMNYFPENTAQ